MLWPIQMIHHRSSTVMPGLDPGIHVFLSGVAAKGVDPRVKPGGGGKLETHRFDVPTPEKRGYFFFSMFHRNAIGESTRPVR